MRSNGINNKGINGTNSETWSLQQQTHHEQEIYCQENLYNGSMTFIPCSSVHRQQTQVSQPQPQALHSLPSQQSFNSVEYYQQLHSQRSNNEPGKHSCWPLQPNNYCRPQWEMYNMNYTPRSNRNNLHINNAAAMFIPPNQSNQNLFSSGYEGIRNDIQHQQQQQQQQQVSPQIPQLMSTVARATTNHLIYNSNSSAQHQSSSNIDNRPRRSARPPSTYMVPQVPVERYSMHSTEMKNPNFTNSHISTCKALQPPKPDGTKWPCDCVERAQYIRSPTELHNGEHNIEIINNPIPNNQLSTQPQPDGAKWPCDCSENTQYVQNPTELHNEEDSIEIINNPIPNNPYFTNNHLSTCKALQPPQPDGAKWPCDCIENSQYVQNPTELHNEEDSIEIINNPIPNNPYFTNNHLSTCKALQPPKPDGAKWPCDCSENSQNVQNPTELHNEEDSIEIINNPIPNNSNFTNNHLSTCKALQPPQQDGTKWPCDCSENSQNVQNPTELHNEEDSIEIINNPIPNNSNFTNNYLSTCKALQPSQQDGTKWPCDCVENLQSERRESRRPYDSIATQQSLVNEQQQSQKSNGTKWPCDCVENLQSERRESRRPYDRIATQQSLVNEQQQSQKSNGMSPQQSPHLEPKESLRQRPGIIQQSPITEHRESHKQIDIKVQQLPSSEQREAMRVKVSTTQQMPLIKNNKSHKTLDIKAQQSPTSEQSEPIKRRLSTTQQSTLNEQREPHKPLDIKAQQSPLSKQSESVQRRPSTTQQSPRNEHKESHKPLDIKAQQSPLSKQSESVQRRPSTTQQSTLNEQSKLHKRLDIKAQQSPPEQSEPIKKRPSTTQQSTLNEQKESHKPLDIKAQQSPLSKQSESVQRRPSTTQQSPRNEHKESHKPLDIKAQQSPLSKQSESVQRRPSTTQQSTLNEQSKLHKRLDIKAQQSPPEQSEPIKKRPSTTQQSTLNEQKESHKPLDTKAQQSPLSKQSESVQRRPSTTHQSPLNEYKEPHKPLDIKAQQSPLSKQTESVQRRPSTTQQSPLNEHKESHKPFDIKAQQSPLSAQREPIRRTTQQSLLNEQREPQKQCSIRARQVAEKKFEQKEPLKRKFNTDLTDINEKKETSPKQASASHKPLEIKAPHSAPHSAQREPIRRTTQQPLLNERKESQLRSSNQARQLPLPEQRESIRAKGNDTPAKIEKKKSASPRSIVGNQSDPYQQLKEVEQKEPSVNGRLSTKINQFSKLEKVVEEKKDAHPKYEEEPLVRSGDFNLQDTATHKPFEFKAQQQREPQSIIPVPKIEEKRPASLRCSLGKQPDQEPLVRSCDCNLQFLEFCVCEKLQQSIQLKPKKSKISNQMHLNTGACCTKDTQTCSLLQTQQLPHSDRRESTRSRSSTTQPLPRSEERKAIRSSSNIEHKPPMPCWDKAQKSPEFVKCRHYGKPSNDSTPRQAKPFEQTKPTTSICSKKCPKFVQRNSAKSPSPQRRPSNVSTETQLSSFDQMTPTTSICSTQCPKFEQDPPPRIECDHCIQSLGKFHCGECSYLNTIEQSLKTQKSKPSSHCRRDSMRSSVSRKQESLSFIKRELTKSSVNKVQQSSLYKSRQPTSGLNRKCNKGYGCSKNQPDMYPRHTITKPKSFNFGQSRVSKTTDRMSSMGRANNETSCKINQCDSCASEGYGESERPSTTYKNQSKNSTNPASGLSSESLASNYLEDVNHAMYLEKEIGSNKTDEQTIILRFPDPEIKCSNIHKLVPGIADIYFQHSLMPRYCFLQLKNGIDVERTIEAISNIKFGCGYLQAERARLAAGSCADTTETNLSNIDPYTLYIGNLPLRVTVSAIKIEFPNARRIDVGYGQRMKKTRYAFVRFNKFDEARQAFQHAANLKFNMRPTIVRFKRIKTSSNIVPSKTQILFETPTNLDGKQPLYLTSSSSESDSDRSNADNSKTNSLLHNPTSHTTFSSCSDTNFDNRPKRSNNECAATDSDDDNNGNSDIQTVKRPRIKVEYFDEDETIDDDAVTSSNLLGMRYNSRIEEIKTELDDNTNEQQQVPAMQQQISNDGYAEFDSDFENSNGASNDYVNPIEIRLNLLEPIKMEYQSNLMSSQNAILRESIEEYHQYETMSNERKPSPQLCEIVSNMEIAFTENGYTEKRQFVQSLYAETEEYRQANRAYDENDYIYRQLESDGDAELDDDLQHFYGPT